MAIHYRTQALILKKRDLGEADRIFTIFTKEFGKLEVFGKAIRKIKSKLRGGIDIFYLSEIEFIEGKAYKTLTDTVLIKNFPHLRKDLKRLTIAYKIAEISDELIRGQEKDEKIWELLQETFDKLNSPMLPLLHYALIYYCWFWNFLSLLGYEPQLYNCSLCQKKLKPASLYFSAEEGGVICQKCFQQSKSGIEIYPEVVKILRLILKKDWQILLKLKIEKPLLGLLREISKSYLNKLI